MARAVVEAGGTELGDNFLFVSFGEVANKVANTEEQLDYSAMVWSSSETTSAGVKALETEFADNFLVVSCGEGWGNRTRR